MEWRLWQAAGQEAKLLNWLRELDYVNELWVSVCVCVREGERDGLGGVRQDDTVQDTVQ